uniref:Uncharacterized protein n=1 Tax=Steinernema glaseri TaxID=37863 RepID=A0A1I7Y7F0_9BILA
MTIHGLQHGQRQCAVALFQIHQDVEMITCAPGHQHRNSLRGGMQGRAVTLGLLFVQLQPVIHGGLQDGMQIHHAAENAGAVDQTLFTLGIGRQQHAA